MEPTLQGNSISRCGDFPIRRRKNASIPPLKRSSDHPVRPADRDSSHQFSVTESIRLQGVAFFLEFSQTFCRSFRLVG